MRNSIFSLTLFFILVAFLLFADYHFKNLCQQIVDRCDVMEENLFTKSKDENFKESMEIFNMIKDKDTIASIYINHMDYDIILNEALKLSVYIDQEDLSEADASLHLLKYTSEHLKNLQVPNLKNIF